MTYPREYNAVVDFVDRQCDNGLENKLAFIDPERSVTYGQLRTNTRKVANLLNANGLVQEDRIALLAHDTIYWPTIFWGALRAGVIPAALNTLLSTEQYRYILSDTRPKTLFISELLLDTVEPVLADIPSLKNVFVIPSSGEEYAGHHLNFPDELMNYGTDFTTVRTCCDDVAFWLYSSGSTGMPKGVPHVHSSLMETARLFGQGVLAIQSDDVVFSAAKLFFAYGLGNAMSFPMSVGATTILWTGRPTPDVIFDLLKTHQVSIYYGVPTLYAAMLAHSDCNEDAVSDRLRLCVSAGEALPKDVGERWHSLFNVDIIDGVGSTELLHIFLSNRPGDVVYGTSGKEFQGYDLRLVDEHGDAVADDEIGELLVRGSSAANGYWNQRDKSRTTFQGEWTRTGDKYTRDKDGYYHYCGRTDDMFKVSGIWVSPFEVESALISHESVLEAAVVGFEDEEGLTKPKAFVVLAENDAYSDKEILFENLKEWVKNNIGKWKYPRQIEFVADLPKTATGKIQRFKLKER